MSRYVFAGALSTVAIYWLWHGPWRIRNARELLAVGYDNTKLQTASATVAAVLAVCTGTVVNVTSDPHTALMTAITVAAVLIQVLPRLLEAVFLASFRKRRDRSALFFLRRLRLQVAGGTALNDAARAAAQAETDPAFEPVRSAVHAAANTRTEPLLAIARSLAGSPVDTILGTAASAERSGSATGADLDDLIDRAVEALEDERRLGIDKLGRAINTYGTFAMMLPMVPLLLSMMAVVL